MGSQQQITVFLYESIDVTRSTDPKLTEHK